MMFNSSLFSFILDPTSDLLDLAAHPLVTVTGTVKDLRPYLWKATIAVAPLVYGAGIQNKVLEAMACGTPVITNTRTTSALQVQPNRDLIIADTTEAFTQAVLNLFANPRKRQAIETAGRRYVEEYHSWDQAADKLEGIYHELIHRN